MTSAKFIKGSKFVKIYNQKNEKEVWPELDYSNYSYFFTVSDGSLYKRFDSWYSSGSRSIACIHKTDNNGIPDWNFLQGYTWGS